MELEVWLDVLLVALSVVGTGLNLSVLLLARHFVRQREEKAAHIFIASLTAANLLLTALYHPIRAPAKYAGLLTKPWECLGLYSLVWLCIPAAAFSLTLLNLDKLAYFAAPLHYARLLGKWRAVAGAAGAWALCAANVAWGIGGGFIHFEPAKLQAAAKLLNTSVERVFFCHGIEIYKLWYALYGGLFTVLPLVSSLCLSIYLLYLCRRFRLACNAGAKQSVGSQFRNTLFIFVTTLWATVSLVPARSYFLFNSQPHHTFETIAKTLLYLDPIVSPVLTLVVNPMYLNGLSLRLKPLRFQAGGGEPLRRRSAESATSATSATSAASSRASSVRKASRGPDAESLLSAPVFAAPTAS